MPGAAAVRVFAAFGGIIRSRRSTLCFSGPAMLAGQVRNPSRYLGYSMNFADFISKKAIRPKLEATDKEGVIREMAQALLDAGEIVADQLEGIIQKVMDREELGSTGIGRGVAVPHTKHPSVEKLCGAVAVSESGVDFASLDGDPVHLLFLLVSPPDRPGDHLRALENVSRRLRDDSFCRFLKQSKTANDIWLLLEEADNNQFGN